MNDIIVIARPHPFDSETLCATFPAGRTLAGMLGAASISCEASIGGEVVPRALWAKVKPKPGQFVHVRNFPQGGSGSKWLRAVLMIVVVIASIYTAGAVGAAYGATAGSLAGAAVSIVGSMLVTPMVGGAREIAA